MAATIDNAAIVREVYKLFSDNKTAVDKLAQWAHPDAQMTNVPFGTAMGYREYFTNWATAFPDGKVEVVNIVAQGDKVIAEFIGRGTHKGVLNGPGGQLQPTNKRLEMRFVESYDMRQGKIASGRIYFDSASFMAQLGLAQQLPQMISKAAAQPQPRH